MSQQHDIESESLPAHVSICQERYRHLENRLDRVDARLDSIDHNLEQIQHSIKSITDQHQNRWQHLQWAVIGGLWSLVVFSGMHFLGL